MTTYQVGYFIGSLSSTSINRVLSKAVIRLASNTYSMGCSRRRSSQQHVLTWMKL